MLILYTLYESYQFEILRTASILLFSALTLRYSHCIYYMIELRERPCAYNGGTTIKKYIHVFHTLIILLYSFFLYIVSGLLNPRHSQIASEMSFPLVGRRLTINTLVHITSITSIVSFYFTLLKLSLINHHNIVFLYFFLIKSLKSRNCISSIIILSDFCMRLQKQPNWKIRDKNGELFKNPCFESICRPHKMYLR